MTRKLSEKGEAKRALISPDLENYLFHTERYKVFESLATFPPVVPLDIVLLNHCPHEKSCIGKTSNPSAASMVLYLPRSEAMG